MKIIKIGKRQIGEGCPVYTIADIAANHDGSLERAKKLIALAAEAGADAVKFQNHNCAKYVSDQGFRALGGKFSHQSKWKKTVFEVYKEAEVPTDWTPLLKEAAEREGVEYFSTPYDLDMVDHLEPHVNVYKLGSGDINWDEMLEKTARKGKPVILSSGASHIGEVQHAVELVHRFNDQIVMLQCNTNYTADPVNFKYIHLNVLVAYRLLFPDIIVGLSDHTHGHTTAVGAVALGGKVIEKHFTDDITRDGPDHPFSMTPQSWKAMVRAIREMEYALGDHAKYVQENERETVVLQRRCLRVVRDLPAGHILSRADIEFQRPAPEGSIPPNAVALVIGRALRNPVAAGGHIRYEDI